MATSLFLQSVGIGLAIAAPVGPIGLLVIQRTLLHGRALGLATGLGAALADALYGAFAAFGVTALLLALQALRLPLALAGGVVMLWLAWRTWRDGDAQTASAADPAAPVAQPPGLAAALASTFVLTLTNPATVLSFVSIFGVLVGARQGAAASDSPWWMVAGVLLGSALWWCVLCAVVGALRSRFGTRARRAVARGSALVLAGSALWLGGQALRASL
jgi:threonine/homoserine/homoserine lactone efflux protein